MEGSEQPTAPHVEAATDRALHTIHALREAKA
jgi:hypothetical protein